MTAFLALLTSLPTGNSTLRMRVWRALKSTGCGVLRDGVYVLPTEAPQAAAALVEAEAEVKAAGGFAMTVDLNLKTSAQLEHVRKLFDRSEEYGAIVKQLNAAKASLPRLGKRKTGTLVQRLRRALEELGETDFYPGQAQLQAKAAMSALEREAQALSSGEPHVSRKKVRRLDPADYRGRTWATRKDLWVDRLASIWLIRRFIDKNARFIWVDRPRDRPKGSVGFDFDGAEFTHLENRVTFEVLLTSFDLDDDPALASISQAVHFLDVGGIPVPDAKGLETLLRGIKGTARGDDELAREAGKVFDHFYSAYRQTIAA